MKCAALQSEPFLYIPRESENELLEMEQFKYMESEVNQNGPDYIRWVQDSLNKVLGLQLKVDGIMGPQTRSAIRSFQQKQRLIVDGIVGSKTEAAINAALSRATFSVQTEPPYTTPALLTPPAGETFHQTVYGWGQYRRSVKELPSDQQKVLKGVGDTIIFSYRAGGRPVQTVDVCGHADWDTPRNQQREQQMSDERARTATQWLMDYVGNTIANRIIWFERGMGATQLKSSPTSEQNRQKNRRVEVYLDAKSTEVCPRIRKVGPTTLQKGGLVVRVVNAVGDPLRAIVFLTRGGSSIQEAALETNTNGYADFGQRDQGVYTVTATASGPGDFLSKAVSVTIQAGKRQQIQIQLTLREISWVDKVNWDEKFSRNYDNLCTDINNVRIGCAVIPQYKLPLDTIACMAANALNPRKSLCCMTSREIETWLDAEVCVRVHNEIVQEMKLNPGPVVREKYTDWKRRVRKGRPCA